MLDENLPDLTNTPEKESAFKIEQQVSLNGIEMGVLENGVPYLSQNGLAKMCGVSAVTISLMSDSWNEEKNKPRGKKINDLLLQRGYVEKTICIQGELNGQIINAFPEPVCLAILEYYAFESPNPKKKAIDSFRFLAKSSFRQFIYEAVGYSPDQSILDSWRHFHDRVDITKNRVPAGYFGVFHEIASMIVPMISSGVIISDKSVPDISIGTLWSRHWKEKNLDSIYGERIKYEHVYPLYYPQARSNPQDSYAYPDLALPEFRQWLNDVYIKTKFPKYLIKKIKAGELSSKTGQKALQAFNINPYQIK